MVDFDDDGIATIVIERDLTPDEETGIIPQPVAIRSAFLYRAHERQRHLVGDALDEGMQIEDKYASVNVPFSYELLMLTEAGQGHSERHDHVHAGEGGYLPVRA